MPQEMGLTPAYPYVPRQHFTHRYSDEDAIMRGTLFPELDLPFQDFQIAQPLPNTPMSELMVLDFVCLELRLYLDTNPNDSTASELYKEYQAKSAQAKQNLSNEDWVFSPWPWEGEA
ncbi:MAG: spore coat associated protein CotJA [Defluviitaleaceae bacterium]|nr:spore coat associated protein CotJA [Defluviitaleaceae bacterium]